MDIQELINSKSDQIEIIPLNDPRVEELSNNTEKTISFSANTSESKDENKILSFDEKVLMVSNKKKLDGLNLIIKYIEYGRSKGAFGRTDLSTIQNSLISLQNTNFSDESYQNNLKIFDRSIEVCALKGLLTFADGAALTETFKFLEV